MGIDRLESRLGRLEKEHQKSNPIAKRTLADCSDEELLAMTDEELLAAMGVKAKIGANPRDYNDEELTAMIRVRTEYCSDEERIAGLRRTEDFTDAEIDKRLAQLREHPKAEGSD
jgi:hypothetical protein